MSTKNTENKLIAVFTTFSLLASLALAMLLSPESFNMQAPTEPVSVMDEQFAFVKSASLHASGLKADSNDTDATEELDEVSSAQASNEAEFDADEVSPEDAEQEIEVRTKQYNVFCIPVDTSGVVWNFHYEINTQKAPFNRVRIGYYTLPAPMTNADFAELSELVNRLIGTPYTIGGKSPSEGFDCSGFVMYVMNRMDKQPKSGACEGQLESSRVITEENLCPGDLVFFKGTQNRSTVSHVGIYMGDGKMAHCSLSRGVVIEDIFGEYWGQYFECYARLLK